MLLLPDGCGFESLIAKYVRIDLRKSGLGKMLDRLPTENEINAFDTLDERSAVENFLGKDLEQARALFRENFLRYQEDLMFMGPKAFQFYVRAAIDSLCDPASSEDSDAVSSFCSLIEYRLKCNPDEILPVRVMIRKGIVRILASFQHAGYDLEIHGDVASRYRSLLTKLSG